VTIYPSAVEKDWMGGVGCAGMNTRKVSKHVKLVGSCFFLTS
jgi:hypothetical protein